MKIGLLPLYIKLYDDVTKDIRPRLEKFYEKVALEFESRGIEVVRSAFCRLKPEFEEAIRSFEAAGAAAIVTLHMAYSPSLESIEALCDTSLPIVVLDTTETEEFSPMQDSGEIMYCHGIHGVMDMCSLLSRHGVPYAIAAGHWKESDVIDRVCGLVRAAAAARALAEAKVGLVGEAFAGMGDFRVAYSELAGRFGIRVDRISGEELRRIYDGVTDAEIAAEKAKNEEKYDFEGDMVEEEYTASVRSCIAVRKYVRQAALSALTVNFTRIGYNETGLTSMPFLACCEVMEEGIGYAGEGDVMTAALVGALLRGWEETTFVEIFCPDWKNNTLLLSHMGEVNYRICDTRPLVCRAQRNYVATAMNPYAGYARMRGGKGVYVNISRAAEDYRLFVAPAEMLSCEEDNFSDAVRGWMKPEGYTVAEFLETHSRLGATHHSVFVYGATVEDMEYFADRLDLECTVL